MPQDCLVNDPDMSKHRYVVHSALEGTHSAPFKVSFQEGSAGFGFSWEEVRATEVWQLAAGNLGHGIHMPEGAKGLVSHMQIK